MTIQSYAAYELGSVFDYYGDKFKIIAVLGSGNVGKQLVVYRAERIWK